MLKILENNPYRFLGLCSNASARERVSNQNRLKAYLKVGKEVAFPLDLNSLLIPIVRTTETLENANSRINLPNDQIKYALFWFINVTPIDNMGIEYLKVGNVEKAKEIFNKKDDFSSLINRGVLSFILDEYDEGIASITKLIHDDEMLDSFVSTVCGSTNKISEDDVAHLFIDSLLEEIDVKELCSLFDSYGTSYDDDEYLRQLSIDSHISFINEQINKRSNIDKEDADAQYSAGYELMKCTEEELNTILSILGSDDVQYQMIADNLAKHILQFGINFYNHSDDDEYEEIDKALLLQNYALKISVGKLTKDRCQQNVDILLKKKRELPPKEVSYYDDLIKKALVEFSINPDEIKYSVELIKKAVPYLMSIREVLGRENNYYLKTSTLIVSAALHNVIEEFNSIMNDSLEVDLLVNREATLRKIKNVFNEAWKATLLMDKLDMEPEFKEGRYLQNRNSLRNQVKELINLYQPVRLEMKSENEMYHDCTTIMSCNNYLNTFPRGKYEHQVKNKLEKLEFEGCKTTQDCKKFRDKYPNTTFDIIDKWEDCFYSQCNTIELLNKYLQSYPNGKYVNQVNDKIERLTFEACRSLDDYKRYVRNYRFGKFRDRADRFIDEEEMWLKCKQNDSKELYKSYLAKYPNGRYKTEAEQKASACYIATMVYGDYNHPQVIALRNFRDSTLREHCWGRTFIKFYYKYSPKLVEYMKDKKSVNKIIRNLLDKFLNLYNNENK